MTRYGKVGTALAAGYFLWVVRASFASGLASDDPMNLFNYWQMGWAGVLRGNLLFFTTAYRPMGGVFYLPIYSLFKLNPLPYHIAINIILAFDTYLLYRCARLLGAVAPAATVAALLSISHISMMALFLSPSTVYDALCFLFYFGALVYYLRLRTAGITPDWRQTTACLLLYIGALNSKEIGVTLPVLLAGYEVLYQRSGKFRTAAIGGMIAAVYTAGKFAGADSLAAISAYRPVFTVGQYLTNSNHFLDEFSYHNQPWFTPALMAALMAGIAIWAGMRKEKLLWFCLLFVLVTPLPIVFIPRRGQYNLYLPLAGWTIMAGVALWDTIRLLSAEHFVPARAARGIRICLALVVVILWTKDLVWRQAFSVEASANLQRPTQEAIRQFRDLHLTIRPNSRVILLNGPFTDYELLFLASLWYDDHSVQFLVQQLSHFSAAELEKADYLLDWENGHFLVTRAPS